MTVSRTSPDGEQTIEQVTVAGRTYDLPPWISKAEFVGGIQVGDAEDGLGALTACTLAAWELFDPGSSYQKVAPIFDAEWFIPWDGRQELVVNRFTPLTSDYGGSGHGRQVFKTKFTPDGVKVKIRVFEYTDFNDVQVFLVPKDAARIKAQLDANPREYVDDAWGELFTEWYNNDLDKFFTEATKWDSLVDDVTGPDGSPYVLFMHVHND